MSHQILSEAYRWNVAAFHAVLRNFTHKHVFTCCLTVFSSSNKQTNKQTLFWWLLLNLLTSGNIRKNWFGAVLNDDWIFLLSLRLCK